MTDPAIPRPRSEAATSHLRPAEPFLEEPTLAAVHRSVVRLEQQQAKLLERVDAHIETDERRTGLIHEELALLRADLGLRVTAVEQTQSSEQRTKLREAAAKAGHGALAGGKWTLYIGGAYMLLNMAAKRWPELQGIADWLRTVPVP